MNNIIDKVYNFHVKLPLVRDGPIIYYRLFLTDTDIENIKPIPKAD